MKQKMLDLHTRTVLRGCFIFIILLLAQCAPAQNTNAPTPLASPTAPTPTATGTPFARATQAAVPPNTTMPISKTPPQNADQAAQQLVQALELAQNEMRAAQTNSDFEQIKIHAQSALNILVGRYGRWYNTRAPDPSNKLGVLPGEIQPQGGADLEGAALPTGGLALLTQGTRAAPSSQLVTILGDVKMWQAKPRAGYDTIANAVNTAEPAQMQLGKLDGAVPRAVAWQRVLLTQASGAENAKPFIAQTLTELENALAAAREIAK